jgi:hypothetical protein
LSIGSNNWADDLNLLISELVNRLSIEHQV